MSSFYCQTCGKHIIDTPQGYITGCEHHPIERRAEAGRRLEDHLSAQQQLLKKLIKK